MNDNEYFDIDELEPVESEESILAKAADRKRRRHREKRNREKRSREWQVRLQYAVVVAAGICLVALVSAVLAGRRKTSLTEKLILEEKQKREKTDKEEKERKEIEEEENELLSESVLQYRDLMEYYAEEEGIGEYVPVLLAIMEAETKGERDDVMQSSESAGLEPNTLGPEDSIAQACDYFRGLVDRAEDLGCDTKSIIQAYNYGPGYLYYVAEHGGEHSFDLAVEYAEEMSGGRTAAYTHYIADDNGNWMYLYGNMYYVKLVEQYLP